MVLNQKLAWLGALAFTAFLAYAAYAAGTTATVSWTAPTAFTDNTPIPAGTITGYRVDAKPKNYAGAPISKTTAGTGTSTTIAGLICGNFDLTVVALTASTESDPSSPPVNYATGVTCSNKPNPPTGVTAN